MHNKSINFAFGAGRSKAVPVIEALKQTEKGLDPQFHHTYNQKVALEEARLRSYVTGIKQALAQLTGQLIIDSQALEVLKN